MNYRSSGLLAALIAAFLLLSVSSSALAGPGDFESKRKSYERAAAKDFATMDSAVNGIALYYANSEHEATWAEKKPSELFSTLIAALSNYAENTDSFARLANRTGQTTKKRALAAIRKAKSGKLCRRSRPSLRVANLSLKKGNRNYRLVFAGIRRSNPFLTVIVDEVEKIVAWIDASKRNFTDGYEDNAVYNFGTNLKIDMPQGNGDPAVVIDPEQLSDLSDTLYAWDNELIDLQEVKFVKYYQAAKKAALKSKRISKKRC